MVHGGFNELSDLDLMSTAPDHAYAQVATQKCAMRNILSCATYMGASGDFLIRKPHGVGQRDSGKDERNMDCYLP